MSVEFIPASIVFFIESTMNFIAKLNDEEMSGYLDNQPQIRMDVYRWIPSNATKTELTEVRGE